MNDPRTLRTGVSALYGIVAIAVLLTVGGGAFIAVAVIGGMVVSAVYVLTAPRTPEPRMMRRERRRSR